MAFTNVFDNGFPLDTQQAKLLGDDIRKMKVDLQERIAAMSGLDASKPDFGSDTQPAKWNGVLFVASDTGIIYRFVNPNWIPVALNGLGVLKFLEQSWPLGTSFGTSSPVGLTLTIPAGSLNVNSILRVKSHARLDSFSGTPNDISMSIGNVGEAISGYIGGVGIAAQSFAWVDLLSDVMFRGGPPVEFEGSCMVNLGTYTSTGVSLSPNFTIISTLDLASDIEIKLRCSAAATLAATAFYIDAMVY